MCSIGRGPHQSSNQNGWLVRCLSTPLGQKAVMLTWRVQSCVELCNCLPLFYASVFGCSWGIITKVGKNIRSVAAGGKCGCHVLVMLFYFSNRVLSEMTRLIMMEWKFSIYQWNSEQRRKHVFVKTCLFKKTCLKLECEDVRTLQNLDTEVTKYGLGETIIRPCIAEKILSLKYFNNSIKIP